PPLASVQPVSFTASSSEAITRASPSAKASGTMPQLADAALIDSTLTNQSPTARSRVAPANPVNTSNQNSANEASQPNELSQQQAALFAMTNVSAMSAGDVNTLTSLYGSQVDYQDKGVINNDAVRTGFQEYFARWPQTTWQLVGAVTVQPLETSKY